MILDVIVISACVVSTITSVIAFTTAFRAIMKVEALDKSTHSVQYVPVDYSKPVDEHGFEVMTKELKEKLENDDLDM